MEPDESVRAVRAQVADLLFIDCLDGAVDDVNLFDLGFDSLRAIELMSRLRDSHGVDVSVRTLFDNPTIGELAKLVRSAARTP